MQSGTRYAATDGETQHGLQSNLLKPMDVLDSHGERGDFLRRLHTLSSTETSGIGDCHTTLSREELNGKTTRQSSFQTDVDSPRIPRRRHSFELAIMGMYTNHSSHEVPDEGIDTNDDPVEFDELFSRSHIDISGGTNIDRSMFFSSQERLKNRGPNTSSSAAVQYEMGEYCTNSPDRSDSPTSSIPGDFGEGRSPDDHHNSSRRNSRAGKMESDWMRWGRDRRDSMKKRNDKLEQHQKQIESKRTPTPVKKARKESLKFVAAGYAINDTDLSIDDDIPEIEENPRILQRERLMSKASSGLTPVSPIRPQRYKRATFDPNVLTAFWQHKIFTRGRIVGITLSIIAFITNIISIANHYWLYHTDQQVQSNHIHSGLWLRCNSHKNTSSEICTFISDEHWQRAVIGLLIFTFAFGLLATVLSICGIFSAHMGKKVYFYHSSGEMFFICGLNSSAALIIYLVAVEYSNFTDRSYGVGFIMGWFTSISFYISATCMELDELVRYYNKTCTHCCSRGGVQHV
ncbi:unnamed protein product [Owenia fusiformis]|uniref:Uncharacterized protein n=1 Tax=Owenia fusiformis TaxID=6347 RepID=A0A8S4N252_OWEFU|nr:unnamed protein product [Owenia fusiformis]